MYDINCAKFSKLVPASGKFPINTRCKNIKLLKDLTTRIKFQLDPIFHEIYLSKNLLVTHFTLKQHYQKNLCLENCCKNFPYFQFLFYIHYYKVHIAFRTTMWHFSYNFLIISHCEWNVYDMSKGTFINHVDMAGGGGLPNVHITT